MDQQEFTDLSVSQGRCTQRARTVALDGRDGLRMYILEAFPSSASDPKSLPLILLLHGFPELAYSWRKILVPLAEAHKGYHVVAPDLRGYGRTIVQHSDEPPKQIHYDDPLAPFHILNIVEDVRALIKALGHDQVSLLVGHDFGSPVAGHCVYAYPKLFQSVVFMSAPFSGVERPPRPITSPHDDTANITAKDNSFSTLARAVSTALASLTPPRKHYTAYFSTRDASRDMLGECPSPEDLYNFLGGYYHMKSGVWEGNTTHPLPCASNPSPTIDEIARDLATLPEYYAMPAHENMRQVISKHASQNPNFTWSPEDIDAGRVYAREFTRTGFQGGLNYYRCALSPPPAERIDELIALSERKIAIPAAFISGARDWGIYQTPGAVEKMRQLFSMEGNDFVLVEGAGHWVQQEAPEQVITALVRFIEKVTRRAA